MAIMIVKKKEPKESESVCKSVLATFMYIYIGIQVLTFANVQEILKVPVFFAVEAKHVTNSTFIIFVAWNEFYSRQLQIAVTDKERSS